MGEGDVIGLGLCMAFVVDDGVEVDVSIRVVCAVFFVFWLEERLGSVLGLLHLFCLPSQSLHMQLEKFLVCTLVVRLLHY